MSGNVSNGKTKIGTFPESCQLKFKSQTVFFLNCNMDISSFYYCHLVLYNYYIDVFSFYKNNVVSEY